MRFPLGATGKIDKKLIRERMKDYVLPAANAGGAAALSAAPEPKIYAPEPAKEAWLDWTPGPDQTLTRSASGASEEAPADAPRPFPKG